MISSFSQYIEFFISLEKDGSSEYDAFVWSERCNLICLRHFVNRNHRQFFLNGMYPSHVLKCSELPSHISAKEFRDFYSL